MIVGRARIFCDHARYLCSSVSTFAIVAFPLYFSFSFRRVTNVSKTLHGPHQLAKKSTRVTQVAICVSKVSCVR